LHSSRPASCRAPESITTGICRVLVAPSARATPPRRKFRQVEIEQDQLRWSAAAPRIGSVQKTYCRASSPSRSTLTRFVNLACRKTRSAVSISGYRIPAKPPQGRRPPGRPAARSRHSSETAGFHGHLQRLGEVGDAAQRDIAHAPLDIRHVGPVQVGPPCSSSWVRPSCRRGFGPRCRAWLEEVVAVGNFLFFRHLRAEFSRGCNRL